MSGDAGRPVTVCRRCLSYIQSIVDGTELNEIQRILVRIIHRGHQ